MVVASFVLLAAASVHWSRQARQDRPTLAAGALCAAVANMGNMGLPVAALAFGEAGLEIAAVGFVASSVLTYSGGVVLASSASGSAREALRAPLRVPALWAALAALAVRIGEVPVPDVVGATSSTLAGAAIPAVLVLLGLQVLQHARALPELRTTVVPLGLRLCAAPAIAAVLATSVGLDGVTRSTLVVLGGMPTAVNTTILATQYHARHPDHRRVDAAEHPDSHHADRGRWWSSGGMKQLGRPAQLRTRFRFDDVVAPSNGPQDASNRSTR